MEGGKEEERETGRDREGAERGQRVERVASKGGMKRGMVWIEREKRT